MTLSIEEREDEAIKLNNEKIKWETKYIKMGGDKDVIHFIANVLFHGALGVRIEDSIETIRSLYEAGYCYYFARMLEEAFPGGQVCLCFPYGHIVYIYDGIAYDICGISDAEYEMYIPVTELDEALVGFKHISKQTVTVSRDDLRRIGERCRHNNTYVIAKSYYDCLR